MAIGEIGRIYSNGDYIFREGDVRNYLCIIQSGKVKITKKTDRGELTLRTLEKGDIFGEMALFEKITRSASARASGEARIVIIDKKKF